MFANLDVLTCFLHEGLNMGKKNLLNQNRHSNFNFQDDRSPAMHLMFSLSGAFRNHCFGTHTDTEPGLQRNSAHPSLSVSMVSVICSVMNSCKNARITIFSQKDQSIGQRFKPTLHNRLQRLQRLGIVITHQCYCQCWMIFQQACTNGNIAS